MPRTLARFAGALLAASLAMPQLAAAGDYQLGPQDKLHIRVAEWQTVDGTFRDWSAINGEYSVGPAGTLSVPFVGDMQAAGKTTAEIASSIGLALQRKLALPDKPEASVEMAQFRPFYISGEVQNPGQFPFVPDLTVLKAISIAGGIRRSADYGPQLEKDLITAKGSYDIYDDQRLRLMVKRARIDADLAGKTTFEVPQEIQGDSRLPTIVADETAILVSDQKSLKLKLDALDALKGVLQSEIESLQKKIANQQKQVDLAEQQANSIGPLAQKGLIANARLLSSQQTVTDLQGKILDYETAILTAKQSISKAEQDAIDARNTLGSSLTADRQQTEANLNEAALRVGMQKGLIAQASDPATTAALTGSQEPPLLYSLLRDADGKTSEIEAKEDTPVLPGDVIKVKLAPTASQ
ncbi:polysaccharide biosynthesis/export family protein [Mesorhizobium sp.]|uniref:polysaccharide biosynthesis/export family protein n=1 Tax=Mesorhizobium sp. TaxID=1871066 RepID=UPI000FE3765B|nr:polysaccharide biosynthesis/export family protein [Mesorhizobium sp.]RWH72172.1 MAG: sugar ABC transporter substrate-binding protein [Mesorhizobium sp.]RWL33173.1 MAG: sugar ABC transporter substrate-binding protein [Mesorhizobium sp.]RWL34187.1 MAG: sugar ABC transporter substrate-binding protein [Mesorhizobium sp.]RWL40274.1 MAG: sugar ABC transporter substrate-binding protein [Mesorhizobium sp.]RWL51931.1 MAG: sugar ABC transporter substrate-binding protein [Mesorhizobium sp.]